MIHGSVVGVLLRFGLLVDHSIHVSSLVKEVIVERLLDLDTTPLKDSAVTAVLSLFQAVSVVQPSVCREPHELIPH